MKVLSAASILFLLKGAMAEDCPEELTLSTVLNTDEGNAITFKYAIILSPMSESLSLLCARLESDTEGFIGFGISPDGTMNGGQAIIGKPDDADDDPGTVLKYTLQGISPRTSLVPSEHQTLMYTSIRQEDGNTIMEFAKYLEEPGEHRIMSNGENRFVYALGSSSNFGWHGKNRGNFTFDFETTRPPTLSETLAPTYGGLEVSEPMSGRTLAPSPGFVRGDPVPTIIPTPGPSVLTLVAPAPEKALDEVNTPETSALAPTPASTPDPPSGAMARHNFICSMILGAWAVAICFGM